MPNFRFGFQDFIIEYRDGKFLKKVDHLYESQGIGENGLLRGTHFRVGTIFSEQDCHFAIIEREDFLKIVDKSEMRDKNKERCDFLESLPLFKFQPKKVILANNMLVKKQKYVYNNTVYQQNKPALFVYIVYKGEFCL